MNEAAHSGNSFLFGESWLPVSSHRKTLDTIVIAGLTGTGKTDLSLALAQHFADDGQPVEIVNADALQFYRGMDIGTAKLSEEERNRFPHHLFDFLEVRETATVADFQNRARTLIAEIQSRGAIPILVGGSGLYLSAVFGDFDFPPSNSEIRTALEEEATTPAGQARLRHELETLDPTAAERIDFANIRRVIRALEVTKITGEPFRGVRPEATSIWQHSTLFFLDGDRDAIRTRLAQRTAGMYEHGLLDEVRGLLTSGLEIDSTAGQAIGYAQAISVLEGTMSTEEAIAETVRLTQRFARRQRSWFNRTSDKIVLNFAAPDLSTHVYQLLKNLPTKPSATQFTEDGRDYAYTVLTEPQQILDAFQGLLKSEDGEANPLHNGDGRVYTVFLLPISSIEKFLHSTNRKMSRGTALETLFHSVHQHSLDVPEAGWVFLPEDVANPFAGARGAVEFLLQHDMATLNTGETIPLLTAAGPIDLSRTAHSIQLDMGRWKMVTRIGDTTFKIRLGAEYVVQIVENGADVAVKDASTQGTASSPLQTVITAEFARERVRDGVGVFNYSTQDGDVSNATAGAAALALRDYQHKHHGIITNFWRAEHELETLAVRMYPTEEGEHVAVAGPVTASGI